MVNPFVTKVVFSVAPYHILTYGTLLGASIFHSFINGIVMFKTVDRPTFSAIQQKLFPIYFNLQMYLPLALVVTFPGNALLGVPDSIWGVATPFAQNTSFLPILVMFLGGFINLNIMLPLTTECMTQRQNQMKKDDKNWWEPGPHSKDMEELNTQFKVLHGMSSVLNLMTIGATIFYGFTLGGRILSVADFA